MRAEIKTTTEQGEDRIIHMANEIHNQRISLYDGEVEIYRAATSSEFLEECLEPLILTDSDIEEIRNFRTGLETE